MKQKYQNQIQWKKNFKIFSLNRKAMLENFAALIITFIMLILIFGFLFFLMNIKEAKNRATIASDLNIQQGMYSTRVLLNSEVKPDYYLFESVIDYVNGENPQFALQLSGVIKGFYPKDMGNDRWLIIVNNNCFVIDNSGQTSSVIATPVSGLAGGAQASADLKIDDCPKKNEMNKMPKVTVPNPDGENIVVLFKPESYLDGASSRLFGYRADMMKGIPAEMIPDYSFDGQKLEQIENIPNIECDAAETSVGKICAADEHLVQRLRDVSADLLQKQNMKIVVTQAYRTYEIQKRLYNEWCDKGNCGNGCNPDTNYACPHMLAGAVDIIMYDSNGKPLNGQFGYDSQRVEDIMCSYGFVRYNRESWHFEYGTRQWSVAEQKRANGIKACTY